MLPYYLCYCTGVSIITFNKEHALKKKLLSMTAGLLAIVFTTGFASAQGQYVSGTTGLDLSYPNCTAKVSTASFGVVGINNGLPYSQNPCLGSEAAHFSNVSYYMNTGYPGSSSPYAQTNMNTPKVCQPTDLPCIAYDYGYNAGLYSVSYVKGAGLNPARAWWLDVETMNTWTNDTAQNQQALLGMHDALQANGATMIGAYSTTYQWNTITGSWSNLWPSWGATTWKTARQAATYCSGHQFTGGPSVLMQYTGKHFDEDYAC
jgi:hypothetical protein